jgi:uridylate kinase
MSDTGTKRRVLLKLSGEAFGAGSLGVNPDAHKIHSITYQDALQRGLKVVDSTAFSLCMDNSMPMRVFGMAPHGNVTAAILGAELGTLVSN